MLVHAVQKILERNPVASRERFEGPAFRRTDASDLPGWPKPMITDVDGRFAVHGIGRGLRVSLTVVDPRYAQQDISIDTDDPGDAKQFTMALQPATIINGRVTYADTGKPVPHAWISVGARKYGPTWSPQNFHPDNGTVSRKSVAWRPVSGHGISAGRPALHGRDQDVRLAERCSRAFGGRGLVTRHLNPWKGDRARLRHAGRGGDFELRFRLHPRLRFLEFEYFC